LDGVYYGGNVMIATPEGGESMLYLLLAGGSCCGASHLIWPVFGRSDNIAETT
jgi:hypothetical protein